MSSSRGELLSPEGLRGDGRRANELRRMTTSSSLFTSPDGSASFTMGNTTALAEVYGPREPNRRFRSQLPHDRALIHAEYSLSRFSTSERRKIGKGDRGTAEISSFLKKSFESVILCEQFPRSQIDIFVQVEQADGGERSAAINAATLALIDAGIPVKDILCGCAAGVTKDGIVLLDPNHQEEIMLSTVEVGVMPKSQRIVSLYAHEKMPLSSFDEALRLATTAAAQDGGISGVMTRHVRSHAMTLLDRRGILPA